MVTRELERGIFELRAGPGVGPFPEMGWDWSARRNHDWILRRHGDHRGAAPFIGTMLRLSSLLMRLIRLLVRRLLRVSLPGGLDILSLIACQLWFVQIIKTAGQFAGCGARNCVAGGVDQLYAGSGVSDCGCDARWGSAGAGNTARRAKLRRWRGDSHDGGAECVRSACFCTSGRIG